MIFIILSCQNPVDIDTTRVVEYDYKIKHNLNVPLDTIDFGFIDKDAFEKKTFTIQNIKNDISIIKNIRLEKVPSYFFFDPLTNLTDIVLNPNAENHIELELNVLQRNVGIYNDRVKIETDSTYYINVKSIVPDVMVKDYGKIELNYGETKEFVVTILNHSNHFRIINGYFFRNNTSNMINGNSQYNNVWVAPLGNQRFRFRVTGKERGTFYPNIHFFVQYQNFHNLIVKNDCQLEIVVN